MVRKIAIIILCSFVLVLPRSVTAQTISLGPEKVVYNLPYPGLLPDHPLYFLKAARDRLVDIAARDYIKKAELYLEYSDKRAAMALSLVESGKDRLAISTFLKGEKYFWKIPNLIRTSKKQGVSASNDFISKLKLANAKHKETLTEILKKVPQGQTEAINEIVKVNDEIRKELSQL